MSDLINTGTTGEVWITLKFSTKRRLTTTIAVTPDEAADSLIEWIRTFDIKHTGEYWAPRGPR